MRSPVRARVAQLGYCAAFLLLAHIARANTYNWVGGGGNADWSNPNNWKNGSGQTGMGVPGAADSATIFGSAVDLSAAVTVANLTLQENSSISGADLTVTVSCTFTDTGVTLIGPGTLDLQGDTSVVGVITIEGRKITNSGTMTLKGASGMFFKGSPTSLVNTGTIQVDDESGYVNGRNNPSGADTGANGSIIDNQGTIKKIGTSDGGEIGGPGITLQNGSSNFISSTVGALNLAGTVISSGVIEASQDATLSINGDVIQLRDGAKFQGLGTINIAAGNYVDGTVTISTHVVLTSPSLVLHALNDETAVGDLVIDASGTFDCQTRMIQGSPDNQLFGKIEVQHDPSGNAGGVMNWSGATLNYAQITADGVINLSGDVVLKFGVMSVNFSGILNIQSDGSITTDAASNGIIFNSGFVIKSHGDLETGATQILSALENYGTLECDQGSLTLGSGSDGNLEGAITVGSGAILNIAGGNHVLRTASVGPINDTLEIANEGGQLIFGPDATLTFPQGTVANLNSGTFEQIGGTISGPGQFNLKADTQYTWNAGSIVSDGVGTLVVNNGAKLILTGFQPKGLSGWVLSVKTFGNMIVNGTGALSLGPGGDIDVSEFGLIDLQADSSFLDASSVASPARLSLGGYLKKTGGTGTSTIECEVDNNGGFIHVDTGTLTFAGQYVDKSGTAAPGTITLQHGNVRWDRPTTTFGMVQGSGTINAPAGWTNDGTLDAEAINVVGDLGSEGSILAGDAVDITFRSERSAGVSEKSEIAAAPTPGVLTIQGNFTQTATGSLYIPIQGTNASTPDFGQLNVSGTATLAGSLFFTLGKGFIPPNGATFSFLTANSISGSFGDSRGGSVAVSSTEVTASSVTGLPNNSLLNISTRLPVETGSDVSIAGFIVQGAAPKKVMVRGIGPSLTAAGVNGALADPVLELHDSTGAIIATNDNWQDTQQADISASGIAPSDTHESAIIATLFPGAYTAVLSGVGGATGVGLVEVYDLDQTAFAEPVNISTRGHVDTGSSVMIGGFIIGGSDSMRVLVRAIGPSLQNAGVSDALQDPFLELHNGNGILIFANDNWKDAQQADIAATGIPPSDDRESAIIGTLQPGSFTAVVRDSNGGTGVGLVEVYNLR